jgi:hypothetical protein
VHDVEIDPSTEPNAQVNGIFMDYFDEFPSGDPPLGKNLFNASTSKPEKPFFCPRMLDLKSRDVGTEGSPSTRLTCTR